MSSKCNDFRCECCYPPLFRDELISAHNYDMELLPFEIWGAATDELFNMSEKDIFNYQWVLVDNEDEQKQIIAQKLPYISSMGFCKAVELTSKAA